MTRYVRNQFTDPAPGLAAVSRLQATQRSAAAVKGRASQFIKRRVVKKAFYSDEEDYSEEETIEIDVVQQQQQQQQQLDVYGGVRMGVTTKGGHVSRSAMGDEEIDGNTDCNSCGVFMRAWWLVCVLVCLID